MKQTAYGHPLLHALLRNEGLVVNHKRSYRIHSARQADSERVRGKPEWAVPRGVSESALVVTSAYRLPIDPMLTLHSGALYNDEADKNFRAFLDSSPDLSAYCVRLVLANS